MKKPILLAFLAAAIALAGAAGPLTLSAEIKRASFDLLDGVNVSIAVNNHTKKAVATTYSDSDTYDIRLLSPARKVVWAWSEVHKAAPVRKTLMFAPGRNVLIVHIWDGTTADGRAVAPGTYTIHANLSDDAYRPAVEIPVRFEAPIPIAAAKKLPLNAASTIAGTVRYTPTGAELTDAGDSIVLSRRIAMPAPAGIYVVRGYLTKVDGGLVFEVDRFARAYDNFIQSVGAWLTGDFGGAHISMHADSRGGTMQFDCAHAQFGTVTFKDSAHATATGTFTPEHGGPVRVGEILPSKPATFSFEQGAGGITVMIAGESGARTLALRKDAPPQLYRCL